MARLNRITLRGFKSIRELDDFKLERINILVGANGAGKSNLVDFFRMLRAMADGGLRSFITDGGGGDGFLFNGPKETPRLEAHLLFGANEYRFALTPTAGGDLSFAEEATRWPGGPEDRSGRWREHGPGKEAKLRHWRGAESSAGDWLSVEGHVNKAISGWTVYHFHDTSRLAPVRRECKAYDYHELAPDAGNLAAFLLHLRDAHPEHYARIADSIRLLAPFFDDFLLVPEQKGAETLVRLQWHQQGSRFPFQPWHLSDGTLRFICLATALLQPKPPSMLIIDEPELGQHPIAIEALSALLHEAALRTQLLVCTQSPLLLDHFDPQDLVIVERRDGASLFHRLDAAGLSQWLDDYSLGELTRRDIIETGPRYG
jgi:predicted ATPase